MKTDCIISGYKNWESVPEFDDTPLTDEWQLATYLFARGIYEAYNLQCVVDVGCGSAYKLIKLFGDAIIGIESNKSTLNWLIDNRKKEGLWLNPDQYAEFLLKNGVRDDDHGVLMICSDVIEHVEDPVSFFEELVNMPWSHMIIGTPCRELGSEPDGPPGNIHHYREWEMSEFRRFLDQWKDRFDIRNHCIINPDQRTQVAWLERKYTQGQETESPLEVESGSYGQQQ